MKNKHHNYTLAQIEFLRINYLKTSLRELAIAFNISFDLNLTYSQIKGALSRNHITSGRDGCFEIAHTPWNFGTKGMRLTVANKGTYKKGNVPPNRRPLGSERIDSKDGYVYIKVAERNPYTGFSTRYKLKHVHRWEQTHGKVPPGKVVIFQDGNKFNFDPDNLVLVSRAELLRLNQYGYKEMPNEFKPSVLSLVKLEVKAFELLKNRRKQAEVNYAGR